MAAVAISLQIHIYIITGYKSLYVYLSYMSLMSELINLKYFMKRVITNLSSSRYFTTLFLVRYCEMNT